MKIKLIKTFIIVSMLSLLCTACADSNKDEATDTTNATQATQVSDSATATEATTQPPTEEVTEATTEADESEEEKKIVADIYNNVWCRTGEEGNELWDEPGNIDDVEKLADRYLGAISSEEDAVEKGQAALIELYGRTESDYEYVAEYKEEYGVWVVKSVFPPPYVDEDGKNHGYVGTKPYIVIRESDGKALGTFSR